MNIKQPFFSESEPDIIKDNSEIIKSIIVSDDLDAQRLLETVEQREQIILEFLKKEPELDRTILQDLIKTNQELTDLVNSLKTDQQKVLVNFLRTRKAVKKYQ